MKTLKDYEIKRGDWVKLRGSWAEASTDEENGTFFFYGYGALYGVEKVEAVLRPSGIVRDNLDDRLSALRDHPAAGLHIVFRELKSKEEKKSLFENVKLDMMERGKSAMDAQFVSLKDIEILCSEIDKLKEGKK